MLTLGKAYRLYGLTRDASLVAKGARTALDDPPSWKGMRFKLVFDSVGMTEGGGFVPVPLAGASPVMRSRSKAEPWSASKCSKMLLTVIVLLEVTLFKISMDLLNQKTMQGRGTPCTGRGQAMPSHSNGELFRSHHMYMVIGQFPYIFLE